MTYCGVVTRLASDLASAPIASRGLQTFKEYLTGYTNSSKYIALQQQTKELSDAFSAIVYGILIQGSRVDVRLPQGELGTAEIQTEAIAVYRSGGYQLIREELTESGINKTVAPKKRFAARAEITG